MDNDEVIIQRAKSLDFDFKVGADFLLEAFESEGFGSGKYRDDGTLELHTGGWSGCETIISAASKSVWWMRWWYSSTRGGHYIFGEPK